MLPVMNKSNAEVSIQTFLLVILSGETILLQGPVIQSRAHRCAHSKSREFRKSEHPVSSNQRADATLCINPSQTGTFFFFFYSKQLHVFSLSLRILAGCGFTGQIPDELGNLAQLTFL